MFTITCAPASSYGALLARKPNRFRQQSALTLVALQNTVYNKIWWQNASAKASKRACMRTHTQDQASEIARNLIFAPFNFIEYIVLLLKVFVYVCTLLRDRRHDALKWNDQFRGALYRTVLREYSALYKYRIHCTSCIIYLPRFTLLDSNVPTFDAAANTVQLMASLV